MTCSLLLLCKSLRHNPTAACISNPPTLSPPLNREHNRQKTKHQHVWYAQTSLASTPPTMAKRMCPPPGIVRLTFAPADQDSTMHSSPSMAADDDEMFPDEALPSTPRNAASHALATSSELLPPNSQPPANLPRGDSFTATIASNVNENGKRPLSLNPAAVGSESASAGNGLTHADPETGYQWSRAEDQPGYEWKCQRAREEEMRALDQIVDKGSQIKSECGCVGECRRWLC